MARAGLGMKAEALASAAGVSYPTLNRLEKGQSVTDESAAAIAKALRDAGAQFSARGARVSVSVPD